MGSGGSKRQVAPLGKVGVHDPSVTPKNVSWNALLDEQRILTLPEYRNVVREFNSLLKEDTPNETKRRIECQLEIEKIQDFKEDSKYKWKRYSSFYMETLQGDEKHEWVKHLRFLDRKFKSLAKLKPGRMCTSTTKGSPSIGELLTTDDLNHIYIVCEKRGHMEIIVGTGSNESIADTTAVRFWTGSKNEAPEVGYLSDFIRPVVSFEGTDLVDINYNVLTEKTKDGTNRYMSAKERTGNLQFQGHHGIHSAMHFRISEENITKNESGNERIGKYVQQYKGLINDAFLGAKKWLTCGDKTYKENSEAFQLWNDNKKMLCLHHGSSGGEYAEEYMVFLIEMFNLSKSCETKGRILGAMENIYWGMLMRKYKFVIDVPKLNKDGFKNKKIRHTVLGEQLLKDDIYDPYVEIFSGFREELKEVSYPPISHKWVFNLDGAETHYNVDKRTLVKFLRIVPMEEVISAEPQQYWVISDSDNVNVSDDEKEEVPTGDESKKSSDTREEMISTKDPSDDVQDDDDKKTQRPAFAEVPTNALPGVDGYPDLDDVLSSEHDEPHGIRRLRRLLSELERKTLSQ